MENILFQISTTVSVKTINEILGSIEYDDLVEIKTLSSFHIITGKLNPIQQDKLVEKFKENGYSYNGHFVIS